MAKKLKRSTENKNTQKTENTEQSEPHPKLGIVSGAPEQILRSKTCLL